VRLANNVIDLLITAEVGPRIIRFGFVGERNELVELPPKSDDPKVWNILGGHRLWYAPEDRFRSYLPDNGPSDFEEIPGGVRVTQPVEPQTGIQKQIDVILAPDSAEVRVIHRIINYGVWTVELAPWALSVMAAGGKAIVPVPPRGTHATHLLPSNTLTFWAYTDLSDPRWKFSTRYFYLTQDPTSEATRPQKIGISSAPWAAYQNGDHVFVKQAAVVAGAKYPDLGCAVEIFTNDEMLEVETVAPLVTLAVGQSVEHVEDWSLLKGIPPVQSDDDVDAHIAPR
jgi:hypothetical protein